MTAAAGPRVAELCAGYGGLGMGLQAVLGGRLEWYAEWDDAPSAIMAHHHPDATNYRDVTSIDWHNVPPVDVITAGFPCQPFSHAGKRLGANDERHLWPHIARGIDVMRPQLVLLENVRGLMSGQGEPDTDEIVALDDRLAHIDRALDVIAARRRKALKDGATFHIRKHTDDGHRLVVERRRTLARAKRARRRLARAIAAVLGDLAGLGYDAQWYGFRAADVGAPHGRWRVFIFAWPADAPSDPGWIGYGDAGAARHAASVGMEGVGPEGQQVTPAPPRARLSRRAGARPADLTLLPTPEAKLGSSGPDYARAGRNGSGGDDLTTTLHKLLPTPSAADAMGGHASRSGDRSDELLLPGVANALALSCTYCGEPRAAARCDNCDAGQIPPDRLLPTPTAEPTTGNGHARDLGGETRLLPTPQAHDHAKGKTREQVVERMRAAGHGVANLNETIENGTEQDWREYEAAIRRWKNVIGRAAPSPTEIGAKGQPRLSPRFVEWMMGLPEGHVTDPAIGLTRNEELKALGNGVVPQQSAAATWALVQDMRAERDAKAASA